MSASDPDSLTPTASKARQLTPTAPDSLTDSKSENAHLTQHQRHGYDNLNVFLRVGIPILVEYKK